jgi:hypothetical protein
VYLVGEVGTVGEDPDYGETVCPVGLLLHIAKYRMFLIPKPPWANTPMETAIKISYLIFLYVVEVPE